MDSTFFSLRTKVDGRGSLNDALASQDTRLFSLFSEQDIPGEEVSFVEIAGTGRGEGEQPQCSFLSSCSGVKAHGLGRPLPFSKHTLGVMCLTLKQVCTRIKSLRQSFG